MAESERKLTSTQQCIINLYKEDKEHFFERCAEKRIAHTVKKAFEVAGMEKEYDELVKELSEQVLALYKNGMYTLGNIADRLHIGAVKIREILLEFGFSKEQQDEHFRRVYERRRKNKVKKSKKGTITAGTEKVNLISHTQEALDKYGRTVISTKRIKRLIADTPSRKLEGLSEFDKVRKVIAIHGGYKCDEICVIKKIIGIDGNATENDVVPCYVVEFRKKTPRKKKEER